jgi:hypothetical protein
MTALNALLTPQLLLLYKNVEQINNSDMGGVYKRKGEFETALISVCA